MNKVLASLVVISVVSSACATGIGKKISTETLQELREGKGKLTKTDVRAKIGTGPQAQVERDGLTCDSYVYSGMTNYILFTVPDKAQSFNFCYDNSEKLQKVDGVQGL